MNALGEYQGYNTDRASGTFILESARGTAGFVPSGFIPRFSIIPISLDLSKNQNNTLIYAMKFTQLTIQ